MNRYDFQYNREKYKANYKVKSGVVISLSITRLEDKKEVALDLLFPKGKEQTKFLTRLKIHSLKYLGC